MYQLKKKKVCCQNNIHLSRFSHIFFVKKKKAHVAPVTDQSKTDPIMLLMAAAQVVDGKDYTSDKFDNRKRNSSSTYSIEEARRRDAYPNGRYYLKPDNKRIRTSPPTPAPSTYKVDTWRKNYRSMQVIITTTILSLYLPRY